MLTMLLCLAGAAGAVPDKKAKAPEDRNPAFAPITENPALPRVLIIGDSISIGYTLDVRKLLEGKANVLRIPVNGGPTVNGVKSLEKWLSTGKWSVIHFNWGLHDVKRMKDGKMDAQGEWQVSAEEYKKNLETLVGRMKSTGARLIWATTTPVPDGADGRVKDDEVKANAIAAEVMRANGVAVDDLYARVLPQLQQYQRPKNVHFTDEGYAFLAKQVANSILDALKALPAAPKEETKK
jgi:acyl-CoA thioesterase-1